MKKSLKIIYLVIFFLFALFIFSNNTKADEIELKDISFNDSNLYYELKEKIASSINSYNDETLTISIYSNILDTIKNLELSNRGITDISGLSNFNNLTTLDITGNKITDITPLSNLTKLTTLTISNNKVEDISCLSNLNLHNFTANDNEISDISALKNMNITYLDLKNNNIKDISCINMSKIENLDLSYNSIEDFSNITANNTEYKFNNQVINIKIDNTENVQLPNIINQAMTNFEASKIETDNCTISEDYKTCNIETDVDYARIKIVGGIMDNTIIYLNCDSENMGTLTRDKKNNNLNMYMIYIIIGCIALMCILIIIYIVKHKKAKNMEV